MATESKKIIYSGGWDCDLPYCRCPHCGEDLTYLDYLWNEDLKCCPYCGGPVEDDEDFWKS